MSDQSVVGAFRAEVRSHQPTERLAALFGAHADRLYRLARRLSPTADDARDLVQETFLRAASALRSMPSDARHEEAWLVRVLVNIQRDEWRKSEVRKRHAGETAPALNQQSNTESELIARTTIWRALDLLSPRRRAVVVMAELEGLSISTIASLLGITAITTRWHLSKGRRDLARVLKARTGEAR
ncbi:MAG: RNA polymerase sigma factor [Acidobacteria bacterium]|nr:MAG: RNA polymerase sigma factor [Acidobacteriota bacterium]